MFRFLILVVSVGVLGGCVSKNHRLFAYHDFDCGMSDDYMKCMNSFGCVEGMSEKQCGGMISRHHTKKLIREELRGSMASEMWVEYKKAVKKRLREKANSRAVGIRPDRAVY